MSGDHRKPRSGSADCPGATGLHRSRISPAPFLLLTGLLATLWFLLRVIPKPSRAAYPCMRVAAPLASSFVTFLVGMGGAVLALRSTRSRFVRRRRILAVACAAAAVLSVWFGFRGTIEPFASARYDAPLLSPNTPLGTAVGANPGRVVWVHDPDATDWAGPGSGTYWWEGNHTDQARVDAMVSKAIRWLAGKKTDADAWSTLFRWFNQKRGEGSRTYRAGEKIVIKMNLTTCNATSGNSSVDPNTGRKRYNLDSADTSMHVILALLRQLVNGVGVAEGDIAVGDTVAHFPNEWYDHLAIEFPGVRYLDHDGALPGRTGVAHSGVPLFWSTPGAAGKVQDTVPRSYAEAAYLINVPVLKGHAVGITISSKNHFGSLVRSPIGQEWGSWKNYYDLHLTHAMAVPGLGHYRSQVDLMGHESIGGKTLLVLVDALYCGYYWRGTPYRWFTPPFNGDWPSSLFASQDPVAVDCVGYDFLDQEWPDIVSGGTGAPGSLQGAAEDYLIEAALADAPPSGTVYDPEQDGVPLASLGVHEHWNNAVERKYSRNLGTGDGIELVVSEPAVSRALSVLSSPDSGVPISGTHPVVTNRDLWIPESTSVALTAPATVARPDGGLLFVEWVLNGVSLPAGQRTASFTITADTIAEAVYLPHQDGDGTLHVPGEYAAIQDGINLARAGETVLVAPGRYVETIDFAGHDVVVASSHGAAATTIDGAGAGSSVLFAGGEGAGAVLDGFTVTGGRSDFGGGILCAGSSPTIVNNVIRENSATAGGGIAIDRGSPVVANNRVLLNSADEKGGGAAIRDATVTLTNDTFHRNDAKVAGGGLVCSDRAQVTVVNAIFRLGLSPSGSEMAVEGGSGPSNLTVSHSAVAGGQAAIPVEPGSTLHWGTGMIVADPLLAGPPEDLHLTWFSPCRDAGDDNAVAATCDMEGDPRIALGRVDIGADEFDFHLYHLGRVSPGGAAELRVVGFPGAPVTLFLGAALADPPYPTRHGLFRLAWPPLRSEKIGVVPPTGILALPVTVPAAWAPGSEHPAQALVGPLFGTATQLTNAERFAVE